MVAAVITGAAGDLGQALSEAFLADGYRVYGGDIAPVEPRAGLVPVHLDVTERAAMFALAERAAAEAGPLEALDQRRRHPARGQGGGCRCRWTGSGSSRSTSPARFTAAPPRSR